MQDTHYKKFINLFRYLSDAASFLTRDDFYPIELKQKIILSIENITEESIFHQQPYNNLFGEIKENLLTNSIDRKAYLTTIIDDFKDISFYLNINADKEYCTYHGNQALKIGHLYFSEEYISVHKLLEKYCNWTSEKSPYQPANEAEKYLVRCFIDYCFFFKELDALCFVLKIDLDSIQKEMYLHIFQRDEASFLSKGYSEELVKEVTYKIHLLGELNELKTTFSKKQLDMLFDNLNCGKTRIDPKQKTDFTNLFFESELHNLKIIEWKGSNPELATLIYKLTKKFEPKLVNEYFKTDNKYDSNSHSGNRKENTTIKKIIKKSIE